MNPPANWGGVVFGQMSVWVSVVTRIPLSVSLDTGGDAGNPLGETWAICVSVVLFFL